MSEHDRSASPDSKTAKSTAMKSKLETAREKARGDAKNPKAENIQTDEKLKAKGRAVRGR